MPTTSEERRRVLVVGSRGHLGKLVIAACRARGDLDVAGSSRLADASDVRLDVTDPATFDALDAVDVVIDACDTSRGSPVDLALACLDRGIVFMATSADPEVFRSLLACATDDRSRDAAERSHRGPEIGAGGPGAIVLGAGTFPGLSTALLEAAPRAAELEYRARWSVLSAAGRGTVEVMVDALSRPALAYVDGGFVQSAPLAPIERRVVDGRERTVVPLSVPDVALAPAARGARSARFVASVRPSAPAFVLRAIGAAAGRGAFRSRPIQALVGGALVVLRGVLFRRRTTPLRIELHRTDGNSGLVAAVECCDAFAAGASAVAAMAAGWPTGLRGLRFPYEGLPLRVLAEEIRSHAKIEFGPAALGEADRT
ncbi:MAG: hypothetical protein AAGI22_28490 [Planctomycetota bacterium]